MFFELQRCDEQSLAEAGDVVLVSPSDAADQSMQSESLQDTADLAGVFAGQHSLQPAVGQAADVVFASQNREDRLQVGRAEEVEAPPAAVVMIVRRARDPFEVQTRGHPVIELSDKVEVAPGRCLQEFM